MKKIFAFVAAALFAGSMFAETAVMKYTGSTTTNMKEKENNAALVNLDPAMFNVEAIKDSASANVGLNKAGTIRLYAHKDSGNGNELQVTITNGTITSIALDIAQTASYVVMSGNKEVVGTGSEYTINATSFSIKNITKGESTQLHLNSISINYAQEGVLASPAISPAEEDFADSLLVSMTAAEGAKIYYTLDASAPTKESTEYAAPFVIKESTTVKAIAVLDTEESAVAEKKYHKIETINVAKAIEIGMALDSAATSENIYTISGIVVNAEPFSLKYGNQIWFMVDDTTKAESQKFEAYACTVKENDEVKQVVNGDEVKLTGYISKYYNNTDSAFLIEVKNGVAEFVKKAEGNHDLPKTDTISVAKALEIGKALAADAVSKEQYFITGYVSYITTLYSSQYKNETFWIADSLGSHANTNEGGAFYVYRGSSDKEIGIGAKVCIKAYIKNYKGNTIENDGTTPVTVLAEGEPVKVDTISVEEALAIAKELEEEVPTFDFYTVAGFAGTTYPAEKNAQTWYMADYPSAKSDFQASSCSFDKEVQSDDYMLVTGRITKHKSSKGNILYQIYKGTAVHATAPKVDTINVSVAEAVVIAKELNPEKGESLNAKGLYAVTGYVVGMSKTGDTYYLSDDANAEESEFSAYKCDVVDSVEVQEGDLVVVIGAIQNYRGVDSDEQEYNKYQVSSGKLMVISGQGIENVVLTEKAQKVVVDGVLYIIRDEKMYNVQGTQVR